MSLTSIDIFNYSDPKKYIKDFLTFKKSVHRKYNYQFFASKAGIKSPAHFSLILASKSRISTKLIPKICTAFELKKNESKYFETLVFFDQAKSHEIRVKYFEKLLKLNHLKTKDLKKSQYEIFSKWYFIAIRELIDVMPFTGDYQTLALKLNPPITVSQAKKSILALEKNGLIYKNSDGRYLNTATFIRPKEWERIALNKFLTSTMELGMEAIDRHPPKNRDISSLTLGLSTQSFVKIKDEIKMFRAKLMEIAKSDQNLQAVYQFNFTAFPLTTMDETVEDQV